LIDAPALYKSAGIIMMSMYHITKIRMIFIDNNCSRKMILLLFSTKCSETQVVVPSLIY